MDQVSRPVQILLLATVVFAVVWFAALRPKSVEEAPSAPAPAAPAATPSAATPPAAGQPAKSAIPGGLGKAVDKARTTRDSSNDQARRTGQAAAAAAAPPSSLVPSPAGVPSATPGGKAEPLAGAMPHSDNAALESGLVAMGMVGMALGAERAATHRPAVPSGHRPVTEVASPERVTSALAARKTVVLLFYGRGSDDRAMRQEVAKVERRGARVTILSAPVDAVSRFSVITAGVRVLQSPSVVVVGPSRKARVLPGFIDSTEIDQAVETALRS